jgi:hypothetical protein
VHLFRPTGGPFIGRRGSTGGVQWRPAHRACQPWEGQGVVLAWAAGYGALQKLSGAFAGGGVVWFRGGHGRGPGGFPPCLPCLTVGAWAGETGGSTRRVQGTAGRSGTRARAANHCCKQLLELLLNPAHKVFDTRSARGQNLNFRNFQIGLVIILDRDSKTIFVRSRGGVLLQGYFEFGGCPMFQIQSFADV